MNWSLFWFLLTAGSVGFLIGYGYGMVVGARAVRKAYDEHLKEVMEDIRKKREASN